MDRKSIIGLLLIGAILIVWMVINKPSAEQLAQQKAQHIADSTAQYKQDHAGVKDVKTADNNASGTGTPVRAYADSTGKVNDSLLNTYKKGIYGDFAAASSGDNKIITLENELIKVNISPKGGRVASVELKNYRTFDQKPLILFDADSSNQAIRFKAYGKDFSTDSLYFVPEGQGFNIKGTETKSIAMRLYAGDKSRYLEYVYTLTGNDYMVGFRLNTAGLQNIITNKDELTFHWDMRTPSQEFSIQNQQRASTIYFKSPDENADYVSPAKFEKKQMELPLKWVGFKQQFFTSAIIADNTFSKNSTVETIAPPISKKYVKDYSADLGIPYNGQNASFGMRFYFGPNHFSTLKKYDVGLEGQIDLGWKIFGWLNRFCVIPLFNFLDSFHLNYGIIILILTIVLKLLLLPIAYKTILSSAKMRVLKPEIDELNEKHKNDDPVKKQQATMALYKSAGVNPMAGCIPVLLQMPILIALFRFFPASIELRQQSFLWAHDLSTYDSIYNFGFNVPWYGDHVSLFALLMTGSTLLYTWSNSQIMGTSNQMPGMKWMMYLMPILFLGFMNSYSAGLSWYYFLANMITFGQTWIIQKFVIDHEALHAKIQENKKKPVKMSKFQQRLEQMTKERQQIQTNTKKK
ncbi:MAG: membrane protein insertase YidC [Bacteroidia bacterium]